MNMVSSPLKFNGYCVDEISYKSIDNEESNSNITLHPILKKNILKSHNDSTHYIVKLSFEINTDSSPKSPFNIKAVLSGDFNLEEDADEDLIQTNAISILFPYLRTVVSNTTLNANISPLIIPVVNVAEMLK